MTGVHGTAGANPSISVDAGSGGRSYVGLKRRPSFGTGPFGHVAIDAQSHGSTSRPGQDGPGVDIPRRSWRRATTRVGSRRTGVPVALVVLVALFTGTVRANGAEPLSQSQAPGTLISDQPVTAPGVDGKAYLVSYWSQSEQGSAVDVTGMVFVPFGSPPDRGWPVVSYGHPTDGMASSCAPSLDPSTDVPNVNDMLERAGRSSPRTIRERPIKRLHPQAVCSRTG